MEQTVSAQGQRDLWVLSNQNTAGRSNFSFFSLDHVPLMYWVEKEKHLKYITDGPNSSLNRALHWCVFPQLWFCLIFCVIFYKCMWNLPGCQPWRQESPLNRKVTAMQSGNLHFLQWLAGVPEPWPKRTTFKLEKVVSTPHSQPWHRQGDKQ